MKEFGGFTWGELGVIALVAFAVVVLAGRVALVKKIAQGA